MALFTAFPTLNITEMDLVQALLFALAVLLWEILKWLKLIAASSGCNPHRTKFIKQQKKKLGYDPYKEERPKMSKDEFKKLTELGIQFVRYTIEGVMPGLGSGTGKV